MNAYEKSQELNLEGTDAQKVAILKTLTVSDIPVESVRTWFREKNLWLQRSTGEMFGPLQLAYLQAPQQAKDGLDYLFDAVFAKSATSLRTTDPVWSVKTYELVQLVLSLSPGSDSLVDSFFALDGGRPYKDLTDVEFAAQRTAAASEAAATAAIATKCGKLQDAHIAVSDWIGSNPDCSRDEVLNQFAAALSPEGWD